MKYDKNGNQKKKRREKEKRRMKKYYNVGLTEEADKLVDKLPTFCG